MMCMCTAQNLMGTNQYEREKNAKRIIVRVQLSPMHKILSLNCSKAAWIKASTSVAQKTALSYSCLNLFDSTLNIACSYITVTKMEESAPIYTRYAMTQGFWVTFFCLNTALSPPTHQPSNRTRIKVEDHALYALFVVVGLLPWNKNKCGRPRLYLLSLE